MEEFVEKFRIRMIENTIKTNTPPAKLWPILPFMRSNRVIMTALLGKECYDIYSNLDDDDSEKATSYIQLCGQEICEIIGCPPFEEWNKEPLSFTDEKIEELKCKYIINIE